MGEIYKFSKEICEKYAITSKPIAWFNMLIPFYALPIDIENVNPDDIYHSVIVNYLKNAGLDLDCPTRVIEFIKENDLTLNKDFFIMYEFQGHDWQDPNNIKISVRIYFNNDMAILFNLIK